MMNTKTRKIAGWVLTGLIAFAFIGSAAMKLSSSGDAAEQNAAAVGLTVQAIQWIAGIELICVALFIIPRTGILGTLLLAAYLGGAIVTHLEHQQPAFAPLILQCLVWITAIIRFPELSQRLLGKSKIS